MSSGLTVQQFQIPLRSIRIALNLSSCWHCSLITLVSFNFHIGGGDSDISWSLFFSGRRSKISLMFWNIPGSTGRNISWGISGSSSGSSGGGRISWCIFLLVVIIDVYNDNPWFYFVLRITHPQDHPLDRVHHRLTS